MKMKFEKDLNILKKIISNIKRIYIYEKEKIHKKFF